MRRLDLKFTVRRLMVAVAAAAIGLATLIGTVRLARDLKYSTFSYGWNTSIFPIGEPVRISQDVTIDGMPLPSGTQGVVVADPPDEDSAYPDRLLSVKIIDGQYRGATMGVQRRFLRAR